MLTPAGQLAAMAAALSLPEVNDVLLLFALARGQVVGEKEAL